MTPSAVRRTLSTLPKTMDDTYLRILRGIPDEYKKEVRCVLHLLVVSFRPLTLSEVAEALAVDYEAKTFDTENRLRDPCDILEMCSSLFSLHVSWGDFDIELRRSLQFAHYSVQEYLVSDRIPSEFGVEKIEAHRIATKIALTYLISFDMAPRPTETDFPFLKYAATHWLDHALVLEDGHNPELELMLRLFSRDPETINQDIIRFILLFSTLLIVARVPTQCRSMSERLVARTGSLPLIPTILVTHGSAILQCGTTHRCWGY